MFSQSSLQRQQQKQQCVLNDRIMYAPTGMGNVGQSVIFCVILRTVLSLSPPRIASGQIQFHENLPWQTLFARFFVPTRVMQSLSVVFIKWKPILMDFPECHTDGYLSPIPVDVVVWLWVKWNVLSALRRRRRPSIHPHPDQAKDVSLIWRPTATHLLTYQGLAVGNLLVRTCERWNAISQSEWIKI